MEMIKNNKNILNIGITGHRDLKDNCIDFYKMQLNKLLMKLQKENKKLIILSQLADGADRLIVQEAISLDIPFRVILPMPKDIYMLDFEEESKKEFEKLLTQSDNVTTLPFVENNTIEQISTYSQQRDSQYELAGHYISDNCNALVALWDKKKIGLVGGTGEIVEYHVSKSEYILYHLLVSRNKDANNFMVVFEVLKNTS